jgi:hypothetical protein
VNRPGRRPQPTQGPASVDLYWLPLGAGAGNQLVRVSGYAYEALAAARQHRGRTDLYHSALVVTLDGDTYAIEMAPVWSVRDPDRGVVAEGPVGLAWWGRSRLFRYEIRCWRGGTIPDLLAAVDSPRSVSTDQGRARRLLELAPSFPTATWGLDEHRAGEMWNSNSLTAWLLARSGHDTQAASCRPPARGRAPGWSAGLVVAARAGSDADEGGIDPADSADLPFGLWNRLRFRLGRLDPGTRDTYGWTMPTHPHRS